VLGRGFAGPVLISGIHPSSRLSDILTSSNQLLNLTPAQKSRIALDTAQTTQQNIQSLGAWTRHNAPTEVGVITSTYHAARVYWLAHWQTPQLSLTILPVQPVNAGLKLMFEEYNKLLVAPLLH